MWNKASPRASGIIVSRASQPTSPELPTRRKGIAAMMLLAAYCHMTPGRMMSF
jgi:hypothetical protein